MSIGAGLMVYLVTWWVVIFAVLPWGVKRDTVPAEGHDHGAPQKTFLWQKFLVTTVISAIIWLIINYIIANKMISLKS